MLMQISLGSCLVASALLAALAGHSVYGLYAGTAVLGKFHKAA
jgi:hypothetical protein